MAANVSELIIRARDEASRVLGTVRDAARQTQTAVVAIDRPPRNLVSGLQTVRRALRGTTVEARNLRAAFEQISAAGRKLAAGGGIVTGINAGAVVQAATYTEQLGQIATLSEEGAQATGRLANEVIDLSNAYGLDRSDIAGAYYQALSVGAQEGAEALGLLDVAARGAIAGGSSIQESLTTITSVVNAYGLEFSEAGRVSDVLFATIKAGNTDMSKLGASIANVTPTASALGVEIEEVGAAIAALTLGGTQTSKATTQINSLLQAIAAGGDEIQALFDKLGGGQAVLETQGLTGALAVLSEEAGGSVGRLKALLGSQEAVASALALAGAQSDEFASSLRATRAAAGAASEAFAVMQVQLGTRLKQAMQSISNAFVQLGLALAPMAGVILDLVTTVATVAGEFASAHPDVSVFVAVLAAATLAAGAALIAFAAIGPLLVTLATSALGAGGAVGGLSFALRALASAGVARLAGALRGAQVAMLALGRASLVFIATPLGAAVAALALSVGFLVKRWTDASDAMDEVVERAQKAADFSREVLTEMQDIIEEADKLGVSRVRENAIAIAKAAQLGTASAYEIEEGRKALRARLQQVRELIDARKAGEVQVAQLHERQVAARTEANDKTLAKRISAEEKVLDAATDRIRDIEAAEAKSLQRIAGLKARNVRTGAGLADEFSSSDPTAYLRQLTELTSLRQQLANAGNAEEAERLQTAIDQQVAAAANVENDRKRLFLQRALAEINKNLGSKIDEIAVKEAARAAAAKAAAEEEAAAAQLQLATLLEQKKKLAEPAKLTIAADILSAETKLDNILLKLARISEGATAGISLPDAGALPAFASGGAVRGRGGVDNILAWLSNNEYVVKAQRARRFPRLLDLINFGSDQMLSRLQLPKFANGGRVGEIASGAAGFMPPALAAGATGTPINLHLDGRQYAMQAPPDVASELQRVLSLEVLKRGRR